MESVEVEDIRLQFDNTGGANLTVMEAMDNLEISRIARLRSNQDNLSRPALVDRYENGAIGTQGEILCPGPIAETVDGLQGFRKGWVFGPVLHALKNLDTLNTSNQRVRDIVQGKDQSQAPPGLWVDVRDLALGHVLAMEREAAANRRFFFTAGLFSTAKIADIVRKKFPEFMDIVEPKNFQGEAWLRDKLYKFDVDRAKEVLGIPWTSLEKSIVDTVESLKAVGV